MAKSYYIAGIEFKTQTEAEDHIRAIRDRYADGERLVAQDDGFIRELAMMHPDYDYKRGDGIDYFTVGPEGKYGGKNRCFYICRVNGPPPIDISFIKCLKGANPKRIAMGAMRGAVSDVVIAVKNAGLFKTPPPRCPYLDIELTSKNYHVDHEWPMTFAAIASPWLDSIGGIAAVKVTGPQDNQYGADMTCPEQIKSWREHHGRLAKLRLISKEANLSHAKKAAR
jgi:uncharacterized protein DUF3223